MALEQGKAMVNVRTHRVSEEERKARAIRKAYTRLANLHPHEWTVLVSAAFQEEGLTVEGRLTT